MLNKVVTQIASAIKVLRPPYPEIPPLLLLCDIKLRPGLSALSIATSVISRLPEIGIPNGVNTDGSENIINKFVMLLSEEIVKEIKKNGIAMLVLGPNSINITGTGMSAAGPTTFTGTNVSPVSGRCALGSNNYF